MKLKPLIGKREGAWLGAAGWLSAGAGLAALAFFLLGPSNGHISGGVAAGLAAALLTLALLFGRCARRAGTSSSAPGASRDPLTGLLNRDAFRRRVEQCLAGPNGEPVTLLYADLDRFKEVNDTLGHDTGDQLLKKVAERFQEVAGEDAPLARLGGDEFAAVAVGEDSAERIDRIARAMLEAVDSPFVTDEDYLSVGISIGIAHGQAGSITPRELLRRSDIAMYRAKWDRKNPIQKFDAQMDEMLSFRRVMRNDLAIAITEDQLHLAVQPIVCARSGELASAEALLRWTHPILGPISPAKLIPLAEESGQIFELDDWVLDEALRFAAKAGTVPIAINVSPGQFRHHGFARKIVDRLAATDVAAELLRVEITEGVLVTHTRVASRVIEELREAGIRTCLDDFGTGFSSLGYLKDFRFDFLKVDRSFIVDLESGKQSAELLRAIVDLGHSLGMKVVAEGVENELQAGLIQLLGCDFVQGYFTGAPGPIDRLTRFAAPAWYSRGEAGIPARHERRA